MINGAKLIAENQVVGDGRGYYCFRNLYEREDGERFSVRTSDWMDSSKAKTYTLNELQNVNNNHRELGT